jgi:hypothetical protein
MHEVDDALPRVTMLRLIQAGTAHRDASFATDVGHLRHDQSGAANRTAAKVHHVPIADTAIISNVLTHG